MTESETVFLNVDLDLRSGSDLQPLLSALGRRVLILHAGRERGSYAAHVELSRQPATPDQAIRRFARLVASLPKEARTLWDSASQRDFNIGVQSGARPHFSEFALSHACLRAVSSIGARIVFTVYSPVRGSKKARAVR